MWLFNIIFEVHLCLKYIWSFWNCSHNYQYVNYCSSYSNSSQSVHTYMCVYICIYIYTNIYLLSILDIFFIHLPISAYCELTSSPCTLPPGGSARAADRALQPVNTPMSSTCGNTWSQLTSNFIISSDTHSDAASSDISRHFITKNV